MDVEPARVLKRQDPSLIRGVATVGEESPAHLYRGTGIFGLLAGITPSQEVYAPYTLG